MIWEIHSIKIAFDDKETLNILNGLGAQGWEPYAITGVTHWFKRDKTTAPISANTQPAAVRKGKK